MRCYSILYWRYGENFPAGTPESGLTPEPKDEATRKNYHRIMGYYWLIDTKAGRPNPPMNPGGPRKQWVRSTTSTKYKTPPATIELITDVTASDGPNRETADFTRATGGCFSRWQVYDRTNHLKNSSNPSGGNILFLDGHVTWQKFQEMEHRWFYEFYANPCMWW